jgi:hypothetical protein
MISVTAITPLADSAESMASVSHHLFAAAKALKSLALQIELSVIQGFFIHP